MEYFHQPTNQPVSAEIAKSMTGVDPSLACHEVLCSLGIYPVEDRMVEGILRNPSPVYHVSDGRAIKSNSLDPLPTECAKDRLSFFLKSWFNGEVERLLGNCQVSLGSFFALQYLSTLGCTPELRDLGVRIGRKADRISLILTRVQEATSTEEVERAYQEFLDCDVLHGYN